MRHKLIALALASAAVCAAAPGYAADSGFYIGGGLGSATTKGDVPNGSFDESDTAWKVYGGYRLGGYIPLLDFAGEITYRDFGKPQRNAVEFKGTGFDASLLGIVTLGPVDLFARVGGGSYDIKRTINGNENSNTSSSVLYGVGAGFRLFNFNIRAEWERVEPDNVNHIDMYTINAYYRF
jgi:hypothetical protein